MKKNLFRKMLASAVAVASVCTCLTFEAYAKTTDGTITIVDPGRLENIGECISGEKLQSANIVEWVWEVQNQVEVTTKLKQVLTLITLWDLKVEI